MDVVFRGRRERALLTSAGGARRECEEKCAQKKSEPGYGSGKTAARMLGVRVHSK
jgi:hypothetical protein